MTGLDRGDVVLVWFPNSDLVTFKQRQALVVEASNLGTGIPQILVALITSNPARLGHPSRAPFHSRPITDLAPLNWFASKGSWMSIAKNWWTLIFKCMVVEPTELFRVGSLQPDFLALPN